MSTGNQTKKFDFATAITYFILTLFAGLRNISVGTDTSNYVFNFTRLGYRADVIESQSFIENLKDEPGYYLLQVLANNISSDYWSVLLLIAAVFCVFVLYSINRYSKNRVLSLFVFITLGYYTFCFNAARQAIALSIYLMALPYLINKKFIKYAIIVCIAALFHKTILIAIPLYFIFTMKYSAKSVSLVLIVSFATAFMLPKLLTSAMEMESRYTLYAEGHATGGYLLTIFYTLLAIFFICMRAKVPQENRMFYDVYLQMLICGSAIYLVVSLTSSYVELTRFAAYFQIAAIFLWAEIYNKKNKFISSSIMPIIYILFGLYFYIYITTMANLCPYRFNTQLF
jgi:hypothetical protein